MVRRQSEFFVLPRSVVEQIYGMKEAIRSQEDAFRAMGLGQAKVLPIVHHDVQEYGGHLEIKPGVVTEPAVYGLKLISVYPQNSKSGLSPMQAVVIINDATTGVAVAIMDGVYVTNLRTAAAGALGAKYLARRNSRRVGVLGTGVQGRLQVLALKEVFRIESVKAWSPSSARRRKYADEMEEKLGASVRAVDSVREATREVDILITTTPSTNPIVMQDWIEEGLHINSIGADRRGKQELESEIYSQARLFTDSREVAVQKGLFGPDRISAELGEVVAGVKRGRQSVDEVTIFDSSGVGVQDVVAAEMIYRKARAKKLGYSTKLS